MQGGISHREMAQRPEFRAEHAGNIRVLVLLGEHDVGTTRRLTAELANANKEGDATVVDLTQCGFIDSTSLAVLFHASQKRPLSRFAVVVPPDTEVSRLLDLVAFGEVVPIYPTRQEAISAVENRGPSAPASRQ